MLPLRHAALLFVASLALRATHWLLSPERGDPFVASYQGDAPYWQMFCNGTAGLEAALPFRPPGMRWLAESLWDGRGGAHLLRAVMTLLGALVPPLLYLGLRRSFETRIALLTAWICACSNALIVLGSGLHVEIPYLLLCTLTIGDFERVRTGAAPLAAVRWGLLNAAACLFRAEHLLFVALSLAWLAWKKREHRLRDLGIAVATFVLALLPWQLRVASTIADFNEGRIGGAQQLPTLPPQGSLPWDDDAIATIRAMPAFAQLPTAAFVSDTARVRGQRRITRDSFAALDEAYGCRPEPLHTPLLALYGPLNFFLANCDESDGGFSRAALDRRPQLLGGEAMYPPGLVAVLPKDLALGYPPHLDAVNHGYRMGLLWIVQHPWEALTLCAQKLVITWRGAGAGFGLTNAPLGRDGTREPVDLVTPESWIATMWRFALLLLAAFGAWRLRRDEAAMGLCLWWVARFFVAACFFGYARLGATCLPAIALLWAAALEPLYARAESAARAHKLLAVATAVALLCLDEASCLDSERPTVSGDGGIHAEKRVHH